MNAPQLLTPRLQLRPLRRADVSPAYVAWMNDPLVNRYLESRFVAQTEETVASFVERADTDEHTFLFGIFLRDDGRHIGNVKLGPVEVAHRRADIGILIGDRTCWGAGYASEVIAAVTGWAFDGLGLHKVTAGAYGCNAGSIKAFERAGFEIEATRRAHYRCDDGTWTDAVLLARVAEGSHG